MVKKTAKPSTASSVQGSENKSKQTNSHLPSIKSAKLFSTSQSTTTDAVNKPRNLLVLDATQTITFSFIGKYQLRHALVIQQTPHPDTWPGGALWDLGVLLSCLLVGLATPANKASISTIQANNNKSHETSLPIHIPPRVMQQLTKSGHAHCVVPTAKSNLTVLELGCGVGLTGLVAGAVLNAQVVLLTDLAVVVDRVTKANMVLNTSLVKKKIGPCHVINQGQTQMIATPLCWGDASDIESVHAMLSSFDAHCKSNPASHKPKNKHTHDKPHTDKDQTLCKTGIPDLILIGDVAYQHAPGAPSHFEALVQTMLEFSNEDTLVIFGTRIRMPASVDLLDMMLEHYDEVVDRVKADEMDPAFVGVKHNMSVHFMVRKKQGESEEKAPETD
jgi:predicted nicotinamide N-methyase